jgi:hypothetical protein
MNIALRRQHHNRHSARLLANLTANFDAICPWQHDVKKYQVRLDIPKNLYRFIAATNQVDLHASTIQNDTEHLCEILIVINDHN